MLMRRLEFKMEREPDEATVGFCDETNGAIRIEIWPNQVIGTTLTNLAVTGGSTTTTRELRSVFPGKVPCAESTVKL